MDRPRRDLFPFLSTFLRYPVFGFLRFATLSVLLVALCNFFAQKIFLSLDPWFFFVPFFVTGVFFDIRDLDFCIFVGWCFSRDASYRFTVQIIIYRLTPLFFQASWSRMFFVYGPFLVCRFTVNLFFRYPVFGFLRFFVLQFFIRRISRFPVV